MQADKPREGKEDTTVSLEDGCLNTRFLAGCSPYRGDGAGRRTSDTPSHPDHYLGWTVWPSISHDLRGTSYFWCREGGLSRDMPPLYDIGLLRSPEVDPFLFLYVSSSCSLLIRWWKNGRCPHSY